MRMKRFLPLAFLALASVSGAYGTSYAIPPDQGPTTRAPDNNFHGMDASVGPGSFLTPHARAVYMLDERRATKGMTPRQVARWRHDQQRRFARMTVDERARFQSRLQHRWDKLPGREKRRLANRLANIGTQRNSGIR